MPQSSVCNGNLASASTVKFLSQSVINRKDTSVTRNNNENEYLNTEMLAKNGFGGIPKYLDHKKCYHKKHLIRQPTFWICTMCFLPVVNHESNNKHSND